MRITCYASVLALLSVTACTADISDDSGDPGGMTDGSGSGSGDDLDPNGCSAEAKLVYLVDTQGHLRSFDPSTLSFHDIGQIQCVAGDSVKALALGRDGTAYVSTYSGTLYTVSLTDASCAPTTYVTGQQGRRIYGLGFASNVPGGTDETLYVCTEDMAHPVGFGGRGLAKLALPSYTLSMIGPATNGLEDLSCVLSGNDNAELFGSFYTGSGVTKFSSIDKATGATPDPVTLPTGGESSNAVAPPFVFWGGDLWIFPPNNAVLRYKYATDRSLTTVLPPSSGSGQAQGGEGFTSTDGAAVSTCAPVILL